MLRCPKDNLPCESTGCSFRGGINEHCHREHFNDLLTKELDELLQIYLPDEYYEDIRKKLIPALIRWTVSGSVAAPKPHEDELQSEWERGYKIAKDEGFQLIEKAFLAGRSKTSWEQFKMDNEL